MRMKPSRPREWLYPAGVERDYVRALKKIATRTTDSVEEHVIPALAQIRQDDLTQIPESEGWFETLRQAFLAALAAAGVPDEVARELVATFATRTDSFNARQFHAVLRSAYGVDIFKAEPELLPLTRMWEAENIGLIKSIPTQYLNTLHGRVVQAVKEGASLRDMTKMLRESYALPQRRAELIARDQIGKLNGQLTEYRQTNIGIEEYRWRGVLDARERPEHVAREGDVFKWSDPPEDGHPGIPIRCRCSAAPVLPHLDELDGQIVHAGAPRDEFLNAAARRRMAELQRSTQ